MYVDNAQQGTPVQGTETKTIGQPLSQELTSKPKYELVLFSPCDGIGAFAQTLRSKLNMTILAYTSEILPEALRVTATQHPQDTQLGDVTKISDRQLDDIVDDATDCGHILYAAGTPCQDNSNLKGKWRKGLKGEKSSLFYECARVKKKLEKKAKAKNVRMHVL